MFPWSQFMIESICSTSVAYLIRIESNKHVKIITITLQLSKKITKFEIFCSILLSKSKHIISDKGHIMYMHCIIKNYVNIVICNIA